MQNEEKYRTLFHDAADAIYIIDPKTQRIVDCNLKASELVGYTIKELRAMSVKEIYPRKEQTIVSSIFRKISETGSLSGISGINQLRRDGNLVPVEMNATSVTFGGKKFTLCSMRDVTDRRKVEAALRESEERYQCLSDATFEGIVVHDNGSILDVNKAFATMFGYKTTEVMGMNVLHLLSPESREGTFEDRVPAHKKPYGAIGLRKDGSTFHMEIREHPVCYRGQTAGVAVMREITEQQKKKEKLQTSVVTDGLTGVLNRLGFFTLAEQQCKLARRSMSGLLLLYLHMNSLKIINATFGRRAGDQALIDTSRLLKKTFRESDIIARLGGNEFAVLLPDSAEPDVEHIIRSNVLDNQNKFNSQAGRNHELSLRMGMAHYHPERPCSVDDLLAGANQSMHEDNKSHTVDKTATPTFVKSKKERRGHTRFITGNRCRAIISNIPGRAVIKDISLKGIRLKTSEQLSANKVLRIHGLSCGDDKITINGSVTWSYLSEQAGEQEGMVLYYDTGVKFVGLKQREKHSLESMITKIAT